MDTMDSWLVFLLLYVYVYVYVHGVSTLSNVLTLDIKDMKVMNDPALVCDIESSKQC